MNKIDNENLELLNEEENKSLEDGVNLDEKSTDVDVYGDKTAKKSDDESLDISETADNLDATAIADDLSSDDKIIDGDLNENSYSVEYQFYTQESDSVKIEDEEAKRIREEKLKEYQRQCEYYNYRKDRAFNRNPLILALFGLLTSVFFGLGIGLSIPALIISAIRLKKKQSKTLKWAFIISLITTFICLIVLLSLGYVFATWLIYYLKEMEQTTQIIGILL